MSSKDIDDAELEALLRTLPQAQPSAELDAAILAAAEAALRVDAALDADPDARVGIRTTAAMPAAANDAVMPQAARRTMPGTLARWKVPLALAASVLVAVNMIGPQWFTSSPDDFPTSVAQLPEAAPGQRQTAEAPAAAVAPGPMAELNAAAPPAPPAAPPAAPAAKAARPTVARAPMVQGPVAPEPVLAAAPVADTAADPVREQPASLAPPPIAETVSGQLATAPARKMAPQAQATYPAAADSQADAQRDPQAWLLQIDRALKADKPKDALDEWAKFRRAYPDYAVPKELAERLDALKK